MIKIFISYKNRNKLLANNILTPIQTGRAIADEVFEEMIGDNDEENISDKNERYCELTAQYWVWKNYEKVGNPEYAGFMHYRRQFIFDKNLKHMNALWLPGSRFFFVDEIYENYMEHFSEEKILPHLEDNPDCIAFKRVDITPVAGQTNMKEHFYKAMPAQKKEVFEVLEKVMENNAEYKDTFNEFKNGHYMFCCNSFIMKKDLFFEYSEFLFSVLSKVDDLVDSSKFNLKERRFLGYIGEYLLSVFIFHKLRNPDFKLKEMDGTYVSKEYTKYKKRLIRAKFLSKITFGSTKKRYLSKYNSYRLRFEPEQV